MIFNEWFKGYEKQLIDSFETNPPIYDDSIESWNASRKNTLEEIWELLQNNENMINYKNWIPDIKGFVYNELEELKK